MGRWTAIRIAAALVLLGAAVAARTAAAQDAQAVDFDSTEAHSPRGALWRAAALPGWGQIYNRQYYKVPVAWGGLAGIVGAALYTNREYLSYRHAYFWAIRENANVGIDVPPSWEDDYLSLIAELGLTPDQAAERMGQLTPLFRENRDILRRNRDLLYIGIGLFYGLTILDAYVSAHLLDFDVSEDLSLALHPAPGGFYAGLRLGL